MSDIVKTVHATNAESGTGVSRRAILQFFGIVGATSVFGSAVTACAGPKGSGAAPTGGSDAGGTLSIVLNRNLVSLDNKLNQYDAAVTVQRAVRQALTRIGQDLKPELVLAESFQLTSPTVWTVKLRSDIHYSDKSPVTVEDVETALKYYFQVKAGYVASQFPEQPALAKVDDRTFTLTTKAPVVTLDSLMSNILITPAKANKPEELREGIGTGPFTVASAESGTGTYRLVRNDNYWGEKALLDEVKISYQEEEGARVIAITSAQADVIDTITPESAGALKKNKDIQLVQGFIWEEAEFAGAARVMEALVGMLGDVGVTVKLKEIPKGGDINTWRRGEAGDWDVLGNGYGNQTGLAITNLQGQYGGTAEKEKTRDTYHGFVFPEVTNLLDKASGEPDEAKRDALLKQAQEKIWALWPAMWAWTPENVLAKRKRVATLDLSPANSYDLSKVRVSD